MYSRYLSTYWPQISVFQQYLGAHKCKLSFSWSGPYLWLFFLINTCELIYKVSSGHETADHLGTHSSYGHNPPSPQIQNALKDTISCFVLKNSIPRT